MTKIADVMIFFFNSHHFCFRGIPKQRRRMLDMTLFLCCSSMRPGAYSHLLNELGPARSCEGGMRLDLGEWEI